MYHTHGHPWSRMWNPEAKSVDPLGRRKSETESNSFVSKIWSAIFGTVKTMICGQESAEKYFKDFCTTTSTKITNFLDREKERE